MHSINFLIYIFFSGLINPKTMNSAQIDDTCFPFNSNEEIYQTSALELNEEEEKNDQCSKLFKMKFKIRKYYLNERNHKKQ